jgi:hypothetical protein
MSENLIIAKKSDIIDIADAVRSQTGHNEQLSLTDIANEVRTLSLDDGSTAELIQGLQN